jgi:hypothetical protein
VAENTPLERGIVLQGDRATLRYRSSVFGEWSRYVRKFRVYEVKPYAQHAVSVTIGFCEPRKRRWCFDTIVPDNIRYITVEVNGRSIFDSRDVVPCDMDDWEATRARLANIRRLGSSIEADADPR